MQHSSPSRVSGRVTIAQPMSCDLSADDHRLHCSLHGGLTIRRPAGGSYGQTREFSGSGEYPPWKEKSPAASGWGFQGAHRRKILTPSFNGLSPDRPHECRSYEVEKVRSLDGPDVNRKRSASPTFLPSNPLTLCYLDTSCQPAAGVYLIQGPLRVFTLTVSFVISKFVLSIPVLSSAPCFL